jgi:2-dehydro-3-deoxyphosphogluconate aldolase / (4S)-4-hydroxy-2-oxoglutarate aldolase
MNQKLFEQRAKRLRDSTLVAILRMQAPEHAVEAARAAVRGGFEAVEVTMNAPGATDSLADLAGHVDAILGAGTILEPEQVKEAYDAGAEFIVSPLCNPAIAEAAHDLSIPAILTGSTSTEVYNARKGGADWVKIFPAESLGGPDFVEQILGPLDGTPIWVSGGISAENYLGYLDAGAELIGFATNVFDPHEAADGNYPELERRAIEVCRRFDLYTTERSS